MDIKIKQRIVGIAVLIALFIFCLFLLLQGGKKTQPHLPAINTEPPVSLPVLSPDKNVAAPKPVSIPAMPSAGTHTVSPAAPAAATTVVKPEVNKTPDVNVNSNLNSTASQTVPAAVIPSSTVSSVAPVSPAVLQAAPVLLQKDKQEKPEKSKKQIKLQKQEKHQKQKDQEKTGSYIVQVGAFSEVSHVKSLTDKLQKEGFVVDIKKIKTAKGELTSVSLGGKGVDHVRAEKFKARLEKEFQLKPIIKKIGEE